MKRKDNLYVKTIQNNLQKTIRHKYWINRAYRKKVAYSVATIYNRGYEYR